MSKKFVVGGVIGAGLALTAAYFLTKKFAKGIVSTVVDSVVAATETDGIVTTTVDDQGREVTVTKKNGMTTTSIGPTPDERERNANSVYPEQFQKLLSVATTIPFKKEWHNGTGYFNPICRDEEIPEGLYSFTDNYGRLGLIHKYLDPKAANVPEGQKHLSCVTNVVFQRYSERKDVLVGNSSHSLIQMKFEQRDYLENMAAMIGAQELL